MTVYVPPPQVLPSHFIRDTQSSSSTRGTVLLIGDSMIEWFRFRIARWCKAARLKLYVVIWPSSNLIWWGKTDTLAAFIRKWRPDYVLIGLGSNELLVPHIEKRRPYAERILSQAGEVPVVWIGPPNWTEDKGINKMLLHLLGEGRFYPSHRLVLERLEDGAHPTPSAAYRWADSVALFLRDSALYPLPLTATAPPPGKLARPDEEILLKPHAP
ncbi:MAG: SGNH/GDSL hydrolase family protein [Bacteroidia bacterium]|nr:SGNH/GDSL hydrolase family protein [Bacteroidia bacterium]MDW8235214.1 SGNH/GDSL hydrolase family protein [Bacteroidia bacterium]